MGNDGGSIPKRRNLVKSKRHRKNIYHNIIHQAKGCFCSLSKDTLKKPIVADKLGQIYNKKSIIEFLLNKKNPKGFEHIKSLRDVKELHCPLSDKGFLRCQISEEEFSGLNKFYFLWSCGCVLSKTAIDELHMKDKCLNCEKEFKKEDLISLNYSKEMKSMIQKKLIEKEEIDIINKNKKKNKKDKKEDNLIIMREIIKKNITNEKEKNRNILLDKKENNKEDEKEINKEIINKEKKEERQNIILLGNKTKRKKD